MKRYYTRSLLLSIQRLFMHSKNAILHLLTECDICKPSRKSKYQFWILGKILKQTVTVIKIPELIK